MRHVYRALFVVISAAAFAAAWAPTPSQSQPQAAAQGQAAGTASGLPVPRFVSLKSDKVNMHIGPAKTYEVKWLYQRAGLPVEITAEFETWRRIRDADGTEGWVYHSLLSGRRTGMVTARGADDLVTLHEKPDVQSAVTARLERGVIASVKRCSGEGWCYLAGRGFEGYMQQTRLWGVYPNEKVD
jgi:SH3-like domain-containing protein